MTHEEILMAAGVQVKSSGSFSIAEMRRVIDYMLSNDFKRRPQQHAMKHPEPPEGYSSWSWTSPQR